MAGNSQACCTLANVLLKEHVNDNTDREKQLNCLRRLKTLQVEKKEQRREHKKRTFNVHIQLTVSLIMPGESILATILVLVATVDVLI